MFVKNTESLTDTLLVQFLNGERRFVLGIYLFPTKQQAIDYVNNLKEEELKLLTQAKKKLDDQIIFVEKKYENLIIEEGEFI